MIRPDLDHIPDFLTALPRWLLWREEMRNGKPTKLPMTATNRFASSTDTSTWAPFPAISDVMREQADRFHGVGIVLGDLGTGMHACGIDFDSCLDEQGNLAAWVQPFVEALRTYIERSPGERGLKSFFRCAAEDAALMREAFGIEAGKWGCKRSVTGAANGQEHGPAIEVYLGPGRYFTVTGKPWGVFPEDVSLLSRDELQAIAELVRAATATHTDQPKVRRARDTSRSAAAFRLGARLRREGATFEQMCEAIRINPDTADWCREKGDANGGRELHNIWEKTEPTAALEVITEQSVMREFVGRYSDVLRFNHDSGIWLVWSDHYWKPDTRKLAFSWSLDLCRSMASAEPGPGKRVAEKVRFSAAVETGARAMREVATAQEDWDADPWLLGTPGGVVDLRTTELRAGRQQDMITKITACTPATSPDCPLWLAFLDYAMRGDDQLVRFIQRFFGYCLTGITREEVFLFLFGVAGAGKGTLVETITSIMGDYASAAPMEVFTGQAFRPTEYYRADMAGKRLIAAAEPERGSFWAEAFVKEMTGGDALSGRHPAGRPFTFKPTHKPLLHGNHMPRLRGRSTGMERRLRILPFDRKADPPDPTLKTKLRDEWSAILRWCIEGALAWQKIGLQPPDAVMAANSRYFDAQDAFARWVDECSILDPNLQLEPAALRMSFNAWARANGEEELGGNAFAEAIDQYDGAPLRRVASHGKRWVKGIGLKPPSNDWVSGDSG